jgi:hypothetical protein
VKNTLLCGLACALLSATAASAQKPSVWKHITRPDWGLDAHFYSIADSDTTPKSDVDRRADRIQIGSSLGLNLPFIEIADNFTAGLNPNIGLGASFLSFDDPSFSFELPIYATLKYGNDATWAGSKSYIGAAIGIGYHYNALLFMSGTTTGFGLPSVMAELSIGKRRSSLGLIKLRYTTSLGSHTEEYTSNGVVVGRMVVTQHAFHLLFTPAY